MQVWVDRLEAAERHGNRLDLIGASSVKRGTARRSAGASVSAEQPEAPGVVARTAAAPAERRVEEHDLESRAAEPEGGGDVLDDVEARRAEEPTRDRPAVAAPTRTPATEPESELTDEPPYEPQTTTFEALPDLEARVKELFERARPLPWEQPVPEDTAATPEPPTVTGHTRRVEVFSLAGSEDAAPTSSTESSVEEDPTVERDRRIVELARQGMNQREIAQQVSASRSTVSRVVRRYEDQRPATEDDRELAKA